MMNRQLQAAPRSAGGAMALPAYSYWSLIVPLAIVMIAIIGARAHEGVPVLNQMRPALILGMFGGILAYNYTQKEVILRAFQHPIFKAALIYAAWCAVTVPFALWKGLAFQTIRGLLPAIVLVLVVLLCPPTRATVDRLQRGFVLGCFGTAIGANVYNVVENDGRLASPGGLDSNDLAAVMAMSFPLIAGLVSREKSWLKKLIWIGVAGVQVYTLMRAGSRGGLIAILVSTLFFVIGQRGAKRPIFLVLCVIGGVLGYGVANKTFKRKIHDLINGVEDYNYTDYSGRKQVWARARTYILHNPVLGVGVGNFPIAEGEECKRVKPDQGCKWSNAHNAWLQAGAELGVPGMILLIMMLFRAAQTAWKLWVPHRGPEGMHIPELFAALIGFATAATFLSHAYFYLMFALLGLIGLAGITYDIVVAQEAKPAVPNAPPGLAPAPGLPRPFGARQRGLLRPPRPQVPRPARPAANAVHPFALRRMGGRPPR